MLILPGQILFGHMGRRAYACKNLEGSALTPLILVRMPYETYTGGKSGVQKPHLSYARMTMPGIPLC